jgi:hypothetical protein
MDDNYTLLILDPLEVDTLRGFLGEALASNTLGDQPRETLEGIYDALGE